ncbi:MAG: phosphomethylpyrimidine synthase ThiC, partial [Rhodoferax sp.]
MNAPDKFTDLLRLTRAPLPASRKIYIPGSQANLQVPMREIMQSNGEAITVYDTSGPYTDPNVQIDVRQGLPGVRSPWIEARGDTESYAGRTPYA